MVRRFPAAAPRRGFTLVELLVSMVILSLLVLVLIQITGSTTKTWRYTTGKIEEFREAREAFETMTTRIAQATLNTYWDYDYDSTGNPFRYVRRSELRFLSGPTGLAKNSVLANGATGTRVTDGIFFHAPLGLVDDTKKTGFHGLENLLNVWGYYVEFGDDSLLRPPILKSAAPAVPLRHRYRLMEFMLPSDQLRTYSYTAPSGGTAGTGIPVADSYSGKDWFSAAGTTGTHVLAENVLALLLVPKLSRQDEADLGRLGVSGTGLELAPNYLYDTAAEPVGGSKYVNSKNQLPPVVQLTMVAMDEQSAVRLRLGTGPETQINNLLTGKFQVLDNFSNDLTVNAQGDSGSSLENLLIAQHVNYRIFTTEVVIRGAKWSREQKDPGKRP